MRSNRSCLPPSGGERPLLPPPGGLPEHPLIAAGREKVPGHRSPVALSEIVIEAICELEHRANDAGKVIASVGVDPPLVVRVYGTPPGQRVTDLPVDPVAGQDGAKSFGEAATVDGGQEVARVGQV